MLYAFRCRSCGRLHTSADAGEATTPAACRVCGGHDWEVLADVGPERLKDLGLSENDVEAHRPPPATPLTREPRKVNTRADDRPTPRSDQPRRH